MKIEISKHAQKRMKERLGIKSKKEAIRMANLAFERGHAPEMNEREFRGMKSQQLLLRYQQGVYVFSKDLTLITVLPADHGYKQSKSAMISSIVLKEARRAMAYA